MLAKERFFEKGISPREFRRTRIEDIKDVIEIGNAWEQKAERDRKIRETMESMN